MNDRDSCNNDDEPDNDEPDNDVTWADLGRVLDKFLFLVFLGGQATVSFFFLIPLATGPG